MSSKLHIRTNSGVSSDVGHNLRWSYGLVQTKTTRFGASPWHRNLVMQEWAATRKSMLRCKTFITFTTYFEVSINKL